MSTPDGTLHSYEVREVGATFDKVAAFEDAVDALKDAGVRDLDISMIASHDAVKSRLGHIFEPIDGSDVSATSEPIFTNRDDIKHGKAAAIGLPAYIGASGAGIAIVATGGTLAFAAVVAAAAAAAGSGIGSLFARAIGKHHAKYMQDQLALGHLLLWVRARDTKDETRLIRLMQDLGGTNVHAHSLTRYWSEDEMLHEFDADSYIDRMDY